MTKKETMDQYVLINQKVNSNHDPKDFSIIAKRKYINQVLPNIAHKDNAPVPPGAASSSANEKTCR